MITTGIRFVLMRAIFQVIKPSIFKKQMQSDCVTFNMVLIKKILILCNVTQLHFILYFNQEYYILHLILPILIPQ